MLGIKCGFTGHLFDGGLGILCFRRDSACCSPCALGCTGSVCHQREKPLAAIARVYVEVVQNTPLLLQMCFLYYALAFSGHGLGILLTGVLSLGIYHGAYVAEVVRAGIEAVPKGQLRRLSLRDSVTWGECITLYCRRASR